MKLKHDSKNKIVKVQTGEIVRNPFAAIRLVDDRTDTPALVVGVSDDGVKFVAVPSNWTLWLRPPFNFVAPSGK